MADHEYIGFRHRRPNNSSQNIDAPIVPGNGNPLNPWESDRAVTRQDRQGQAFAPFKSPGREICDDPPIEVLQSAYFRVSFQGTQ
jgi:hypothetical protein